jgi:hypothetical protein
MNQRAGHAKNYENVEVCPQWQWPHGFAAFLADMGERPPGLTLDRIRNGEGYKPDNCRWASWSTQMNNKRHTIRLTLEGVVYTQKELIEKFGHSRALVRDRMKRGMDRMTAITTPVNKSKSHKRKWTSLPRISPP